MKKLIVLGVLLMVGVELLALIVPDRRFVLIAAGAALALVLMNVRRVLGHSNDPPVEASTDEVGESLRQWLASTETTIRWSESTRADWDRHLRPMLALRFELTTGQRQAKDPASFRATGEMLFGSELWEWVNPNNIEPSARGQPGPGRAALEEILRRLEKV